MKFLYLLIFLSIICLGYCRVFTETTEKFVYNRGDYKTPEFKKQYQKKPDNIPTKIFKYLQNELKYNKYIGYERNKKDVIGW